MNESNFCDCRVAHLFRGEAEEKGGCRFCITR